MKWAGIVGVAITLGVQLKTRSITNQTEVGGVVGVAITLGVQPIYH